MKTEIEKVVKEKYPDNMKYGVEYQMDELRPEDLREAFKDGWDACMKHLALLPLDEAVNEIVNHIETNRSGKPNSSNDTEA